MRAHGANNADVAENNANIASAYFEQNKYDQAERLYVRAISVDQDVLGKDHPYIATLLVGLANVYKAQHRDTDADNLAAKAMAISRNTLKTLGSNQTLLASLPADYASMNRLSNYSDEDNRAQSSVKEIRTGQDPVLVRQESERLSRKVADKWALVIGVSSFADPSINLKYAAKDAKDFAGFLVKEGNFKPDHVKLLLNGNATRENILSALGDKWLPRVANPDDLVVIYISSHGSPSLVDVAGVNYLVAYNTDKNSLYATGIPLQELTKMIKDRVHSDRVVVIMDACHSGAADVSSQLIASKGLFRVTNFSADEVFQGTGQLVICSSQPSQSSWESKNYPNGVFTHYLLEGLKLNGDKTTLQQACQYMKDKVQEEVLKDRGELQTPVIRSRWEGNNLVLSVPPSMVRPALSDDGIGNSLSDQTSSPTTGAPEGASLKSGKSTAQSGSTGKGVATVLPAISKPAAGNQGKTNAVKKN